MTNCMQPWRHNTKLSELFCFVKQRKQERDELFALRAIILRNTFELSVNKRKSRSNGKENKKLNCRSTNARFLLIAPYN